jgi:hypothetical protein
VNFNYVRRCQSIVTVVAIGCCPMASPRIGMRHGSPPHEQQSRTSYLRADAALVSPSDSILVSLPLCFKLEHFILYVFIL